MNGLASLFDEIAACVGAEAAEELQRIYGGRGFSCPRPENIGPDHPLATAIGEARARVFAEHFGPSELLMPSGKAREDERRRERVVALRGAGTPVRAIARETGMNERSVYRILARAGLGAGGGDDMPRAAACGR